MNILHNGKIYTDDLMKRCGFPADPSRLSSAEKVYFLGNYLVDALELIKRLEAENASLKANMEHEAARSIQMVNEIADMTTDLDINVLLDRAGMEPYTDGTLSESFVLRIALKRALDERDAAREKTHWISAEEPPKTDEWVAVWYRDKDGDCFPTVGQYRDFAGQKYWTTDVDDNERAYPPEEITHWMPLPGPLEADDHN